jgi:hypothetical protein
MSRLGFRLIGRTPLLPKARIVNSRARQNLGVMLRLRKRSAERVLRRRFEGKSKPKQWLILHSERIAQALCTFAASKSAPFLQHKESCRLIATIGLHDGRLRLLDVVSFALKLLNHRGSRPFHIFHSTQPPYIVVNDPFKTSP